MDEWLREEILTGLQKLLALRLPGTPPEDAIVGTAEVWIEGIGCSRIKWDEQLDRDRVRLAFATLFRSCEYWPSPKLFLDRLGSRAPPKALPEPPLTPDERQQVKNKLRAIVEQLTKSQAMKATKSEREQSLAALDEIVNPKPENQQSETENNDRPTKTLPPAGGYCQRLGREESVGLE